MDNRNSESIERIRIGGIKLSPELVQFTCSYPSDRRDIFNSILANLTARQINIFFLSHETNTLATTTTLCVEQENQIPVHKGFQTLATEGNDLICRSSVGTLTVFPHRSSVSFLSRVLNAFYVNDLQMYGLCTSISALSVITDYSTLDKAVAHLQEFFELPENHAPFRQEFCVRQLGH